MRVVGESKGVIPGFIADLRLSSKDGRLRLDEACATAHRLASMQGRLGRCVDSEPSIRPNIFPGLGKASRSSEASPRRNRQGRRCGYRPRYVNAVFMRLPVFMWPLARSSVYVLRIFIVWQVQLVVIAI
jgi:hypothetical protein